MLKTNEFCQPMPKKFSWAILPVWLLVTTGGDSIGQVEQRGLSKWGGAGSISRLVFYLTFLVDRFGRRWHKQIKAGSNYHANNQ